MVLFLYFFLTPTQSPTIAARDRPPSWFLPEQSCVCLNARAEASRRAGGRELHCLLLLEEGKKGMDLPLSREEGRWGGERAGADTPGMRHSTPTRVSRAWSPC